MRKDYYFMNKDFKVLTVKEEQQLSREELKDYYKNFREYVLERKLTNTTPGATTIAPKLKGITNKIAFGVTKMFTSNDVEWIWDGYDNVPEGPVIFAHSHQGLLDNFVWIPEVDKHCLLFHSQDTNPILLLCQLNTGLILVKKGNRESSNSAKLDIIKLLLNGHSIAYFPESAWNLSPNKLHLPLRFGLIDIAKKAAVPIIPVVHEYTYDTSTEKENIVKIHSRFGKPIYVKEEDSLLEKLEEYKEAISTMRYDLIEEKGIYARDEITNFDYINYLKGNYKNLEMGKISIDNERKHLYQSDDYFYKLHHINDLEFNNAGDLLETKEKRRLKALNKKHNI